MTTTMADILSRDKEDEQQQQTDEPPLQLKQGESKVFSKLFSRESSAAAPSFRVYYGVASAGSVPFLWESQPGTPKNDAVSAATLPPLTPPPSYYTAKQATALTPKYPAAAVATGIGKNKLCKHGFFGAILPKIVLRHRRPPRPSGSPTSSSTCSSSSSSSGAFSSASSSSSLSFRSAQSPASSSMRSRAFAFSAAGSDGEEEQARPATCFPVQHESFRAFKSCRVATTVRSALASVGGHGTSAAAAVAAQRV